MNKQDFNQGWRFYKKGCEASAKTVALPHDAMLYETRDPACKNGKNTGYYPGGHYVYEKELPVCPAYLGKTLLLEFEGVHHNSTLYLNDERLCTHPHGYTGFVVDLTGHLRPGEAARLRLEVDALGEPCSRWYPGSGIYRPVWLYVGETAHILPDGVRITTLNHCPPQCG